MNLSQRDEERFWAKVDQSGDCWLWTSQLRAGYGLFRLNGKIESAHRVSYFMAHGSLDSRQVRHTCDTPACVKPEHLLLGNAKANSDDKMERGRHSFTLTNEQVTDIRSRPLSITMCRELADEFSVSPSQIKEILTGRTYQWLDGARALPPQFTGRKLSPEQVAEVWKASENPTWGWQSALARKFNVERAVINHIYKQRVLYSKTDTE